MSNGFCAVAAVCFGVAVTAGCSGRPAPVLPPKIDASAAGAAAVKTYDANDDGTLDAAELEKCPGILGAMNRYDADGDGKVAASEIADRIRQWEAEAVGNMSYSCAVTLDDEPLVGATVEIIPEEFLGPNVKPASGVTNVAGFASLAIAKEDLPADQQRLRGVQPGVYKVRITHPTKPIPARYNTDTTLGQEIAHDMPDLSTIRFDLKNK